VSKVPILLVFGGEPPPELTAALDGAGLLHHGATPREAARSVNERSADVVVCARVRGWQAMAARVASSSGATVLWGKSPSGPELRQLAGARVQALQEATAIVSAVEEVRAELVRRREITLSSDSLQERAESAERVSRFAQSIALQIDLPHVVAETIARTRDLCDADGASLLLLDPETGELTFDEVAGGAGNRIRQVRLPPGQGIAGHVARTAEALLVESARDSPWFDSACDSLSGFSTGSVIAAPLLIAGDLFGVLEAVRRADRSPFTAAHLRRMTDLATHVSIAVYNAQLTARLRETQALVMRDNAELERRIEERTQQISRAKREWESTFDAIAEPISVQEGFVVRRVNVAFARRAGVPITQVPGRLCYEVFAGRDSPCLGCPLLAGQELSGQITIRGTSSFRFEGYRLPDGDGRVVIHYRDVTRQNLLEERLRESERLAAVGQLASGAAHEINNPLGFLVSNLRTLREQLDELGGVASAAASAERLIRAGRVAEAAHSLRVATQLGPDVLDDGFEMVDESLEGARRVGEIVRALRELSRQQVSHPTLADVNAALSRAVRTEFGDELANVVLQLGPPAAVAAMDPLQLDQALGHVLRNARQAVAGAQRIYVRTRLMDSVIAVEVEDEGCGIPHQHVRRIFEPFFTTREIGKGVGLGLTATWGIIRRHGGDIDVHSEVGRGTRVTLRLPRAGDAARKEDLDEETGDGLAAS
jgi:two-component system, NtrC family, sensor kinase